MITTSIAAMCLFLTWKKIIGELCSPALRKLRLAMIPLLFSLVGCSFVQTVYNQSHELVYWWVDSYVDLQGEQRQTVPVDLLAFQQWHRQEQLPQYILWLQTMQTMARQDVQEEQVCQMQAQFIASLDDLTRQIEPAAARLALSLTPAQMRHLRRKLNRSHEDWRREWVEGSAAERLERRVKKAVERSEDFYGRLDAAQRAALTQWVGSAGLDVAISEAERLRRQRDMLDTLQKIQDSRASLEAAQLEIRQLVQRSLQSPEPAHLAHTQKLIRHNCRQLTWLHNTTTPAQRQKALERLQFYEKTARNLVAQR
jgi:hypothetical protein